MDMPTNAGWYDDPEDDTKLRYFDGVVWTKHTTPRSTRPTSAAAQPGQQQYPGQGHAPQYPGQVQSQPPQQAPGYAAPPPAAPGSPPGAPGQGGWQQPGPPPNQQFPGAPQQGGWNQPAYPGYPGYAARPTTPDGQPLASYWQRVGAFVLDWVLQSVIAGVVGSPFLLSAFDGYLSAFRDAMDEIEAGGQPDVQAMTNAIDTGALLYFSLIGIAVFAGYQFLFLTRSGQTPGKMATGISVRLRERAGVPARSVVLRRIALPVALFVIQLLPLLGFLGLLARLLDLVWPAWDDKKQALHDKVAATNVVVGKQPRG
jgi:uncharacterized RDD family membrane protein YckC